MKETYGAIYRKKELTILGIKVGFITARYTIVEGGAKGYVVCSIEYDSTPIVLAEVAIPNGTIEQVKRMLDSMFDTVAVTKEDIKS